MVIDDPGRSCCAGWVCTACYVYGASGISAESAAVEGAWRIETENEGFTGDGYVVADKAEGTLSYGVRFSMPGRYLVLLRSAAPQVTEYNG